MSLLTLVLSDPTLPKSITKKRDACLDSMRSRLQMEGAEQNFVVYDGPLQHGGSKTARVAATRNWMVEEHLEESHTHVLMVDGDVVYWHADLPIILCGRMVSYNAGVLAPTVLIENSHQFYDTAGFVDRQGQRVAPFPPYHACPTTVVPMVSVGTVMMFQADVWRNGARWAYRADHLTEHWTFCRDTLKQGKAVAMTRDAIVYHANLEAHGLRWNTNVTPPISDDPQDGQ